MALSRDKWFEILAALFGLLVAYSFAYLGWWAFGRRGVVALVIGIPASLALGWVGYRLLVVAGNVMAEDSERRPDEIEPPDERRNP